MRVTPKPLPPLMRSIRAQLLSTLIPGVLLLTAAAGVGLYTFVEESLEHGLDAALAAKADAIAGTVHLEEDGQPHLRISDAAAPAPGARREGPFFYQVWRADGRTLARSAPGTAPLPPPSARHHRPFSDAVLADGTPARVTLVTFVAQPDEDPSDSRPTTQSAQAGPPAERLTLIVAHDRRAEDRPLAVLLAGLLVTAAAMALGIVVVVTWGVRRGLRPVGEVSSLADRIGPESLDVRFPGADRLPRELLPIGVKLNDLLDRLSAAFARERRFSAAVAHELRTPLAELRSACDVALRWPDDAATTTAALAEARDVAVQMSAMVAALLSLARRQAGAEPPARAEPVDLASAVAAAWPGASAAAACRGLTVEYDLDAAAVVSADPGLLGAVLRNLLQNAVGHATAGGPVRVHTTRGAGDRWSLHVTNFCTGLSPADLPRLFEPFWRGNAARTSGGGQVGLGLTLVQAYGAAMDVSVVSTLVPPDQLTLTLTFPPPA